MKVLLSIRPEYAEKILNGTKKFEYRRSLFKNRNVQSVVIYATKPVGKVIGEFKVGGILENSPNMLWVSTEKHSGTSREFYMSYFRDCRKAFAIKVESPTRYLEPLNLYELVGSASPPQSFRYL